MTLYAFVLTVKYPTECWMSKTYKMTNKFNTSPALDRYPVTVISVNRAESPPSFCFVTAVSHFLSLCNVLLNCLNGDLSLGFHCLFEVLMICSRRPSYTKSG